MEDQHPRDTAYTVFASSVISTSATETLLPDSITFALASIRHG
jgi:hypothetical protein